MYSVLIFNIKINKKVNLKQKQKYLKKGFTKTGGRNNQGKLTHFHQGGGHKQLYRSVNFKKIVQEGIIKSIEYDPNRTALIALVEDSKTNYFYNLAFQGIQVGDIINSKKNLKGIIGDRKYINKIPIGSYIHNIELRPNQGGKLIRSSGTYAQVIQIQKKYVKIKLPSNEQRLILGTCYASIGKVSINPYKNLKLKKAGNSRWRGIRPTVRGVAMNPVDHPHGGGEGKTSGGRLSVSPWGKLTKGKKTVLVKNKLITLKRFKKK